MSLERRLAALEARQPPPPEPPTPCPQQVAWLESVPEAEQASAAVAILLPEAHPARDQWAAAWRDWLIGVAQAEHAEDADKVYAWIAFAAHQRAAGSTYPYPEAAESWANYRAHRRACWPKYFGCEEATCACWQWVQAQPERAPGAGG